MLVVVCIVGCLPAAAVGRQIGEYLTKKRKRGKPSDYGVRVIINGKQVSMHSKDVIESVQRFKGQVRHT